MNLIINDKGDQSVGIFPTSYTVETPLDHTDDTDAIEFFRKAAIDLFSQFTDGRITAMYEWEVGG